MRIGKDDSIMTLENKIHEFKINHSTNLRNIDIVVKVFTTNAISLSKYYNYEIASRLCKNGCKNFGNKWSCPPFSKKYVDISSAYKYCYLFLMYTNLEPFSDITNKYLRVKAANAILKSKCEKMAKKYEDQCQGYSLLSGSCRLCQTCAKKRNLACRKPDKIRYSMEATGLDVEAICEEHFGHKLLWYSSPNKIPLYTSVVCCVLSNDKHPEI